MLPFQDKNLQRVFINPATKRLSLVASDESRTSLIAKKGSDPGSNPGRGMFHFSTTFLLPLRDHNESAPTQRNEAISVAVVRISSWT